MSVHRSNQEWLDDLASSGESQNAAIEDLSQALLRAAFYTFERQLGDQTQFSQLELQQMAEDCAQDALLSVLNHLPEFRGESKFLTWAYKFAVNISLNMARREQWKGISLDDQEDFPPNLQLFPQGGFSEPELAVVRGEMWEILHTTMQDELSEKQRLVLKWMVFNEVPMDVVVQHLGTNRNAVYKLLHDARMKLKRSLLEHGLDAIQTIDWFR